MNFHWHCWNKCLQIRKLTNFKGTVAHLNANKDIAPQSCKIAPHHMNISKIQWLHRVISSLIFNKSHSNLASSPILRHSFSCVDRSSLTGSNQKLKNTVELGFITYYMNSSWNSWWYCSSLQLFFSSFILSGPRPDLDPDVVAALDDALDLNDPDNVLDDDFVIKVITIHGIDMSLQFCISVVKLKNTLYKTYKQ